MGQGSDREAQAARQRQLRHDPHGGVQLPAAPEKEDQRNGGQKKGTGGERAAWGKAGTGRPKSRDKDKQRHDPAGRKHVLAAFRKDEQRNGRQEQGTRGESAGVEQGSGREAQAARQRHVRLGEMLLDTYVLR